MKAQQGSRPVCSRSGNKIDIMIGLSRAVASRIRRVSVMVSQQDICGAMGIEFVGFPTLGSVDIPLQPASKISARSWCIESMRSAPPLYPAVEKAVARIRVAQVSLRPDDKRHDLG